MLSSNRCKRESGAALLIAIMAVLLISALGLTLALTTSVETVIAANYRDGVQGLHAAEGGLERALQDLSAEAEWDAVFGGATRSSFVDGPPAGERTLADSSRINLTHILTEANCGRTTPCSEAQMDAVTTERPWGVNNPRWVLYSHAPLADLVGSSRLPTLYYVIVMVADDSSETDGDPLRDGVGPPNPGTGMLSVRAEAFGPRGAHRAIDATLARTEPAGPPAGASGPVVRLLSWRAQ